jgi:hypothetical protein
MMCEDPFDLEYLDLMQEINDNGYIKKNRFDVVYTSYSVYFCKKNSSF